MKVIYIAVCLHIVAAQPSFSQSPRNTAVLAGTTSALNCEFDFIGHQQENIEWSLLGGIQPERISLDANISNSNYIRARGGTLKYFVDATSDNNLRGFDLHVNDTNADDNRYHQCRTLITDVRMSALILVLGNILLNL